MYARSKYTLNKLFELFNLLYLNKYCLPLHSMIDIIIFQSEINMQLLDKTHHAMSHILRVSVTL